MSEIIASYADLAITLSSPHGSDCPCLVCADARKAIGHRALTPEFDPWSVKRPSLKPDCEPTGQVGRTLAARFWPTERGRATAGRAA